MKRFYYGLLGVSLAALLLAPTLQGCDQAAKQCGIECAADGILEGNASITGVASIDGFFAAVVNFNSKALAVSDGINAELAAIAGSVGLDGGAGADFKGSFQSKVKAKFNLDGDIKVQYQEPKCEISAKATIQATAKCDVSVDPGKVSAECSGACEVDPGKIEVSGKCEGEVDAKVSCTGTAPELKCSGECSGECQLDVAASCSGTCKGTCEGTCDGKCDGSTSSGAKCSGQCEGTCSANCKGSCELAAAGNCSGSCKGSCTYKPATAECEAGAKAEIYCEATADVKAPKVKCDAKCTAEVEPPKASADCQAQAKADAQINAECTPPSIAVTYKLKAAGSATADAKAKAEFEAWLNQFKGHLAAIVAMKAQAKFVVDAGAAVGDAGVKAVTNAVKELDVSADIAASYKVASCLPAELKDVPKALGDATTELNKSVSGTVSLLGAFGK
jgi:hypothetical protein